MDGLDALDRAGAAPDAHASSADAASFQQALAAAHAALRQAAAPAALGFLAPAAEAGTAAAGGAALAGAAAGAAVGGMLLGPPAALHQMADDARTHAFWRAHNELARLDPSDPKAAPVLAAPGWVPSDADVSEEQAALAAAKARPAPGTCDAAHPQGLPAPSAPATETGGAGNTQPPGADGVRPDGECDEDAGVGTTTSRARLPTDGTWLGKPGNSGFLSNNPQVQAITKGAPIPFKDGRPDFTEWSKLSVNFRPGELTGYQKADRKLTTAALDFNPNPDIRAAGSAEKYFRQQDLTPHHATDTCIQLVPRALNRVIAHVGGAADIRHQNSPGGTP